MSHLSQLSVGESSKMYNRPRSLLGSSLTNQTFNQGNGTELQNLNQTPNNQLGSGKTNSDNVTLSIQCLSFLQNQTTTMTINQYCVAQLGRQRIVYQMPGYECPPGKT